MPKVRVSFLVKGNVDIEVPDNWDNMSSFIKMKYATEELALILTPDKILENVDNSNPPQASSIETEDGKPVCRTECYKDYLSNNHTGAFIISYDKEGEEIERWSDV